MLGVAGAAVDGFVVYSMPDDDPHLAAALARPVPSVICDQPGIPGADLVGIDDCRGHPRGRRPPASRSATAGSASSACGWAGPGWTARSASTGRTRAHYHVQRNRLVGLREAFTAAGVAWDRIPVVERFEHSVEAGASAAAEVLALDPGITALIATSDVLALGAIEELTRRRQRVPEDVSVTGFDGIRSRHRRQADHRACSRWWRRAGRPAGCCSTRRARRRAGASCSARPFCRAAPRPRPASDPAPIFTAPGRCRRRSAGTTGRSAQPDVSIPPHRLV